MKYCVSSVIMASMIAVAFVANAQYYGGNSDMADVMRIIQNTHEAVANAQCIMAEGESQRQREAEAQRVREARERRDAGVSIGGSDLSIEGWFAMMDKEKREIKNGNWSDALECAKQLVVYDADVPANQAKDYLTLFFLNWNLGNEYRAKECLRSCISVLENRIGGDCHTRAEKLLNAARSQNLRGRFSASELFAVRNFVMEVPNAVSSRNHKQLMAHYDALIGQISASTDVYRREGEYQAFQAKAYAKQTFEGKCHRTFDPDSRPSESSGMRDDWDAAKRIYDIFEN